MSNVASPNAPQKRLKSKLSVASLTQPKKPPVSGLKIRPVRRTDLDAVIDIDTMATGIEKRSYWNSLYRRYADAVATGQHFLVAVRGEETIGFAIGEVRDWEFGSPPCGWVFAIDVHPQARLAGAGTQLLKAICDNFRKARVSKVRTMLARDNTLILSFFRSQGMMIGPFIPLELDLQA
jgi:ribosomal protein S18 acetylase RimI-like enzyme